MLILLNQFNYLIIIFSSVFSNIFENNADDIKTDQIHSGIHLLKQGMVILLFSFFLNKKLFKSMYKQTFFYIF